MLEPLTTLEACQRREIRMLSEENMDLKILNAQQLGEMHRLRATIEELQALTARVAA